MTVLLHTNTKICSTHIYLGASLNWWSNNNKHYGCIVENHFLINVNNSFYSYIKQIHKAQTLGWIVNKRYPPFKTLISLWCRRLESSKCSKKPWILPLRNPEETKYHYLLKNRLWVWKCLSQFNTHEQFFLANYHLLHLSIVARKPILGHLWPADKEKNIIRRCGDNISEWIQSFFCNLFQDDLRLVSFSVHKPGKVSSQKRWKFLPTRRRLFLL